MDKKAKLTLKPWLAVYASAVILASCSADTAEEINRGNEISFSTNVSRATETTLGNLQEFKVYADAEGYPTLFINGETAKKQSGTDYRFDKSYFWPSDVEYMSFWAYGPTGDNGITINAEFSGVSQSFSAYEPEDNKTVGGTNHKDFVAAYTRKSHSEAPGMNIPLTFHHTLSQIIVRAKSAGGDSHIVKVKGAWIVNAKNSGILSFNEDVEKYPNHMHWDLTGAKTASYGVVRSEVATLNNTPASLIDGTTSLMLVPQTTDKITFDKTSGEKGTYTQGAYILLLCRVEAKHEGTDHPGSGPIFTDDKYHYHQLFPFNENAFEHEQYGYTCVPIDINWEPGKKYIYTLEFCGKSSGAGVYPPKPVVGEGLFPDGVSDVPKDKKYGDAVLDNPITFTVDVAAWTDASSDVPMN